MTLPRLRRLHKWVAVIVGAQLLLWSVSGATFAWLDHGAVEGDHVVAAPDAVAVPAELALADPRAFALDGAYDVRLQRVAARWVYRVASPAGVRLHDASSRAPVVLDEATVRGLATALYRGRGRLLDVRLHPESTLETRGQGAAWAARFDDVAGTTLWLAADDGRWLATRTDAWRVYDVFWMLHTMDYRGRDDFNHPLLVLFATGGLWVALTGLLLVVRVFRGARPHSGE